MKDYNDEVSRSMAQDDDPEEELERREEARLRAEHEVDLP